MPLRHIFCLSAGCFIGKIYDFTSQCFIINFRMNLKTFLCPWIRHSLSLSLQGHLLGDQSYRFFFLNKGIRCSVRLLDVGGEFRYLIELYQPVGM